MDGAVCPSLLREWNNIWNKSLWALENLVSVFHDETQSMNNEVDNPSCYITGVMNGADITTCKNTGSITAETFVSRHFALEKYHTFTKWCISHMRSMTLHFQNDPVCLLWTFLPYRGGKATTSQMLSTQFTELALNLQVSVHVLSASPS